MNTMSACENMPRANQGSGAVVADDSDDAVWEIEPRRRADPRTSVRAKDVSLVELLLPLAFCAELRAVFPAAAGRWGARISETRIESRVEEEVARQLRRSLVELDQRLDVIVDLVPQIRAGFELRLDNVALSGDRNEIMEVDPVIRVGMGLSPNGVDAVGVVEFASKGGSGPVDFPSLAFGERVERWGLEGRER